VISPAAFQECLFLITATGAATRGIGWDQSCAEGC
jgi:hypothetical protein